MVNKIMQICETNKWLCLFAKAKSIATVLEQKLVQLRKKVGIIKFIRFAIEFCLEYSSKKSLRKKNMSSLAFIQSVVLIQFYW